MVFQKEYNPSDAKDILRYAKMLIGKTFYDVLKEDILRTENKESDTNIQKRTSHRLDLN